MILKIKNMVCNRCVKVLSEEFKRLNYTVLSATLGEVHLLENIKTNEFIAIESMLKENGFELLKDKKAKIVEDIKNVIIQLIYSETNWENLTLSKYLEKAVGKEYHYLSALFSSVESITIEKFLIYQKVERIKELIVYGEMNFSEIAYTLGYSSSQHLSSQFKKVIGLTPSEFKTNQSEARKEIDKIIK